QASPGGVTHRLTPKCLVSALLVTICGGSLRFQEMERRRSPFFSWGKNCRPESSHWTRRRRESRALTRLGTANACLKRQRRCSALAALSLTLANLGSARESLFCRVNGYGAEFCHCLGLAVTVKKLTRPVFPASNDANPLNFWPKSSLEVSVIIEVARSVVVDRPRYFVAGWHR